MDLQIYNNVYIFKFLKAGLIHSSVPKYKYPPYKGIKNIYLYDVYTSRFIGFKKFKFINVEISILLRTLPNLNLWINYY